MTSFVEPTRVLMTAACALRLLSLAVTASLAAGSGPTSCGNEGGTHTPPCHLPPWPATWQMNASTIIMPCNYTGYQEPSTVAGWGVVDFDWSNNLAGWSSAQPMDNDERQLVQVKMVKDSPLTPDYIKVWIYRNAVYGYPWFTSVRKLLDDPAYEQWFIMFNGTGPWDNNTQWTSPPCDDNYTPPKCSKFFHTQMDTPQPDTTWGPEGQPEGGYGKCYPKDEKHGCDCGTKPCGFYVFNHSSTAVINGQSFRDWFIDSYMLNEVGSSSLVNGFYWDDTWYPGGVGYDSEKGMVADMGLTADDLMQLTASFNANMQALINRTLAEGKFAWQLMNTGEQVRVGNVAECTADLKRYCQEGAPPQKEAMHYALTNNLSQDLASFLLIRGPYAWLGHSWQRCAQPTAAEGGGYPFPPQLHADFGTPMGLCAETTQGSGVFAREFSKAMVKIDCNTGTPTILMK